MDAKRDIYLERVRKIVLEALAGYPARVYLFGSRAREHAPRTADVDVAVDSGQPLPPKVLAELRDALEESTIPYVVDVVDLSTADPTFRERVLSQAVPWTN